jgi:hypothetical protein
MTKGHVVYMKSLPDCDIHKAKNPPANKSAEYDTLTVFGSWAYLCNECFDNFAAYNTTGIGKGQQLKLEVGEPF